MSGKRYRIHIKARLPFCGGRAFLFRFLPVAPGIVLRPDDHSSPDRACKTNYLGEKCTGEDIAALVEFLVSDKARFITGQTYVCDGGRTLAMKGSD